MRRRGPTGEISFSFGERKHLLSMVIIDVAANMGESERRSLGFPPKGQVACKQGAMWLCVNTKSQSSAIAVHGLAVGVFSKLSPAATLWSDRLGISATCSRGWARGRRDLPCSERDPARPKNRGRAAPS